MRLNIGGFIAYIRYITQHLVNITDMDRLQVLDMINANRQYIKLRSNIAVQNLAMLHKSFGNLEDEECILALALNDSEEAMLFNADYARGIAISEEVVARYPQSPYRRLIAAHEALIGRCYTFTVQYEDARAHLEMAERIAFGEIEETDDEILGLRGDILHSLAMFCYYSEAPDEEIMGYLNRALDILPEGTLPNRRGICLMGMANVLARRGELQQAIGYHEQAMALFEEVDNRCNIATVLCNIGSCYARMSQFDQAQSYLDRALDLRTRLGSYWEISSTYYNLGKLYERRGERRRAYDTMIIARDYALVSQHRGLQTLILEELKDLASALGDSDAAAEHHASFLQVNADIAA